MPIELFQSDTFDVLVVRYTKGSTIAEGTESLRTFATGNTRKTGHALLIIDCSEAVVSDLTYRKVSNEASKKVPLLAALAQCRKVAMVARNDVQFGFLRMYEIIASEGIGFETGSFSDDAAALEFVGLPFVSVAALIKAIQAETAS